MKRNLKFLSLLCALALLFCSAALAQGADSQPPALPEGGPGAPPPEGQEPPEGAMGKPPEGMGGLGGGSESSGTGANTFAADAEEADGHYVSTGDQENALRVENGAHVTLTGATIEKLGGETSSSEDSDFYGMNAGALARDGAILTLTGATITTDAVGANAAFAYGEGTALNIEDSTIRTQRRNSGGIDAAGGAAINAANLDVETQGASAAAIRSDRGGGTVNVAGGQYVTNGTGSPAVYSTAEIRVSDATLRANASEAVVVEGKNSVQLDDCTVSGHMQGTYGQDSGENIHAVMIYQSMSGDAETGRGGFAMTGGSLTALAGDLFYVTNTSCLINLSGVALTGAEGDLLRVCGNDGARGWGRAGENGGECAFTCEAQVLEGNVTVDEISTLSLALTNGSAFTGAINAGGRAGEVAVSLDETSTWTLTADSYVTSFSGDASQIAAGEFHLYAGDEAIV